MVWWGWLIISFTMAAATGVVVYAWVRITYDQELVSRERLLREREEVARRKLAAEQETNCRIQGEMVTLAETLKANQMWYEDAKRHLTKGVRDEYEKLVGDRTALSAKLDRLLATPRPKRQPPPLPTDKG